MSDIRNAITQSYREEWARVVASLTRRFGDLDIAEEATAEAFAIAVERWPADAVPPNPGAWLTTTANRKAIDRIRREHKRGDKQKEALMLSAHDPPEPLGAIDDDRLRLIFTCCHPALSIEARVALTLRMVGGLTVPEIARAFLVKEATIGQRITRAKAKIAAARIPYRMPSAEDLPARVSGVLAVLYLVFNEGYLATGPETDPIRHDLTTEAIRLTRLIHALMPEDGEVTGLLALMLLTDARRTARVSASGELVSLDEQDRGAWDAATSATPTGHRSSRSTTSSSASIPRRSSPSIGPSPSPRSMVRMSHWPPSTASRAGWPATTPSTPLGPTCCDGWVAVTRRAWRTTGPSTWRATPARRPTSPAVAPSCGSTPVQSSEYPCERRPRGSYRLRMSRSRCRLVP
ncbi:MAG: polymerase sigma factor [Agromyces sp.]|nr:polymerase sigma factor [Agromyces sp.]